MLARLHSPLVASPAPCSRRTAASRGDGSFLQQPRQQEQQCSSRKSVAAAAAGGSADGGRPPRVSFRQPKAQPSSWNAKEAGGGRSADSDYLSELGAAQQVGCFAGQSRQTLLSANVGCRIRCSLLSRAIATTASAYFVAVLLASLLPSPSHAAVQH